MKHKLLTAAALSFAVLTAACVLTSCKPKPDSLINTSSPTTTLASETSTVPDTSPDTTPETTSPDTTTETAPETTSPDTTADTTPETTSPDTTAQTPDTSPTDSGWTDYH